MESTHHINPNIMKNRFHEYTLRFDSKWIAYCVHVFIVIRYFFKTFDM